MSSRLMFPHEDWSVLLTIRDAHYEEELDYLFEKVKAGADMIFTQMFFEAEVSHPGKRCS